MVKPVSEDDDHPEGTVTVLTEDTIRVSVRTRQSKPGGPIRSWLTLTMSLLLFQIGLQDNTSIYTAQSNRPEGIPLLVSLFVDWATSAALTLCLTVSNISRPLDQIDMHRPREATQELLIRVREGMTKKVWEVGMQAKDEEASAGAKPQQFPKEPIPIKAWTEGPCEHSSWTGNG